MFLAACTGKMEATKVTGANSLNSPGGKGPSFDEQEEITFKLQAADQRSVELGAASIEANVLLNNLSISDLFSGGMPDIQNLLAGLLPGVGNLGDLSGKFDDIFEKLSEPIAKIKETINQVRAQLENLRSN